jgi:hypothetical protein
VGLIIAIDWLKSLKRHRPQTRNADVGSLADPHQQPRMGTAPPSCMSKSIVDAEAATGERVHGNAHPGRQTQQPGKECLIGSWLDIER